MQNRREKKHYNQEDQQKGNIITNKNTRHAEIILNEMTHSDFSNSSKEYQEGQVGQLKKYIDQAGKKMEDNEHRLRIKREAMTRCKELGIDYNKIMYDY